MGAATSSPAAAAAAAARRAELDAAHDAWAVAPASPAALAALDGGVAAAAAALASGAVTAEALALASIARVHGVGRALNAVTHELFPSALAAARASDARRAANAALGPLDGIPVSVKDVFDVAGEDTTNGCAARAGARAAADSAVVAALRAAGAVIVCKSNVPQALMVPETDNNIFGRTLHPADPARTPGGSSGGEGALVAARAVCAGVGSDIGGSIRIPAAFCGLVGFKPTPARVPARGMPAPRPRGLDGQCAVLPVAGPLARSVDDAAALARVLLAPAAARARGGAAAAWTAAGPAQPWDEAAFARARGRELVFAVLPQDGFFALAPPCARAVADAAAALRAAGHTVVDFDAAAAGVDLQAAAVSYFALLGADGALREFRSGLEGEALHPMYVSRAPAFARCTCNAILTRRARHDPKPKVRGAAAARVHSRRAAARDWRGAARGGAGAPRGPRRRGARALRARVVGARRRARRARRALRRRARRARRRRRARARARRARLQARAE